MNIEIVVDYEGEVETYIHAEGSMESLNPCPLLKRAIEALQWQLDSYSSCPYHGGAN